MAGFLAGPQLDSSAKEVCNGSLTQAGFLAAHRSKNLSEACVAEPCRSSVSEERVARTKNMLAHSEECGGGTHRQNASKEHVGGSQKRAAERSAERVKGTCPQDLSKKRVVGTCRRNLSSASA